MRHTGEEVDESDDDDEDEEEDLEEDNGANLSGAGVTGPRRPTSKRIADAATDDEPAAKAVKEDEVVENGK